MRLFALRFSRSPLQRYVLCTPIAGCIALALGVLMNFTLATEFVPQSSDRMRASLAKYVDLPQVTRCGGIRKQRYERAPVKPPAIPKLAIARFDVPPISDAVFKLEFDPSLYMPRVDLKISTRRRTPPHNQRIVPNMPRLFLDGNHSGYCRLRFDLNEDRRPINVTTTLCTDELLREASIEAVEKWRYGGSKDDLLRRGEKTIIRYDLLDETGERLPLPEGY